MCEADKTVQITETQYNDYFEHRKNYFYQLANYLDTDIMNEINHRLEELASLISIIINVSYAFVMFR